MKKYSKGILTVRLTVVQVNFLLSDRLNRLVRSMAMSTCRGFSQKDQGLFRQLPLKFCAVWYACLLYLLDFCREIRDEPEARQRVDHGDDPVDYLTIMSTVLA